MNYCRKRAKYGKKRDGLMVDEGTGLLRPAMHKFDHEFTTPDFDVVQSRLRQEKTVFKLNCMRRYICKSKHYARGRAAG